MKVGHALKSMLSLVSLAYTKRKKLEPPMSKDDIEKVAVSMLAQLKYDEDKIIEDTKKMLKVDRNSLKEIFSLNIEGWTLFHAFSLRGCRKLLKFAVRSGVNVNLKMGQPEGIPGGCSALHLAAHRGDVSIIDILTANGADTNQLDDTLKTPIYYASKAQNTLAVKHLRRAGADLSYCDPEHRSTTAKQNGDRESSSLGNFRFLPFPGCSGTKTKR